MYHTIKSTKHSAALRIELDQGERLYAACGTIAASGSTSEAPLIVTPHSDGSVLRTLAAKFGKGKAGYHCDLLTASDDAAWVMLCPPLSRQAITAIDLYAPHTILCREDSFLAAADTVTLHTHLPRDLALQGEIAACPLLHVSGEGPLFLATTGGIEHMVLQEGQQIRLDRRYLLAWESGVTLAPLKTAVFKKSPPMPWGETKILVDLSGRGRVWLRTRHPAD